MDVTWEGFIGLLSWEHIRDTIPDTILLIFVCGVNAYFTGQYRAYVKRALLYIAGAYFAYFIHLYTYDLEKKWGLDLPLHIGVTLLFLVWEGKNFIQILKINTDLDLINFYRLFKGHQLTEEKNEGKKGDINKPRSVKKRKKASKRR